MKTLKRSECAVLSLVLKYKWYDMIERGEKREEYREKKPYWETRLVNWIDKQDGLVVPVIEFRRGRAADAPRMAFVSDGPMGRNGFVMAYCMRRAAVRPGWGEPNEEHYVIPLGERVVLVDAPDGAGAAKQGCCGHGAEGTTEKRRWPKTWHDAPHSPLPFRDGGCMVFVGDDGHVVGRLVPPDCRDEETAMRDNGNYRYMLCAVNCHEALVGAAKRLLVLLEGRGEDTRELRALVARAEEHFE